MKLFDLRSTLFAFSVLLLPSVAKAETARSQPKERVEACFTAYEETQVALRGDDLVHAEKSAALCASDCPPEIMTECRAWQREAKRDTPTVLLVARNEQGQDAVGVRVEVDGQEVTSTPGAEIPLTVGQHKIHFKDESGFEEVIDAQIVRGEKRRVIRVTVPDSQSHATPKSTETQLTRPTRNWVIASFALSAVGFGVATGTFIGAVNAKSELESCEPDCDTALTDKAHHLLTAADVGLIVGIAAGATGIGLWIFGPREEANVSARFHPHLMLAPSRGGARAIIRISF